MAGRIFVTGDCHGDLRKFNTKNFPQQSALDKDDYVIICGDFGVIWDIGWESKHEVNWLKWLEDKPYTTLFVDGNHENFDRLNGYPVKEWNGGLVHEIRPSVLHLMRGQIFNIAGKSIFTMGGASSHDIDGGILDTEDPEFKRKKKSLERDYIPYRIRHLSWWDEELPNDKEYDTASANLEKAGFKVDYIISHCCASSTQDILCETYGGYQTDALTDFFNLVKERCQFKKWYFGHYHDDCIVSARENLLYTQVIELGENPVNYDYSPGYPKYKLGEVVRFIRRFGDIDIELKGEISIVDKNGTFNKPDEPSYDIYAEYEGRQYLFKHVRESEVLGY